MRLDVPTLLVEQIVFGVFLALLMLLYSWRRKVYPGFALWTGAAFAVAVGYLALLVRPAVIPHPVSIFFTTGSLMLAAMLRLDGILRFVGRQSLSGRWYLLPLLAAAGFACIPSFVVRIFLFSLIFTGCIVLCVTVLLGVSQAGRHLYLTAAAFLLLQGVGLMGRSVAWCLYPNVTMFDSSPFPGLVFSLIVVGEVGLSVAFMLMNSLLLELELADSTRRLSVAVDEFRDTLANLQVLRGFLCICMHCKRIRVRGDDWEQVEVYVHRHSEVEFSQGLCPECLPHSPGDRANPESSFPPAGAGAGA